jgi:hypothetical protein
VTRVNGELEYEYEEELEGELEWEGEEEGEEFLGTLARGAAAIFGGGAGEGEEEYEFELEGEWEGEGEAEEFMRFVRRALPVLRRVASVAAPIVGTAVGGPAGAAIGRLVGQALREGEFEEEFEIEGEFEEEYELEGEFEEEYEAGPPTAGQAVAARMAQVASRAQTELEAEAMIGGATVVTISPADRAALRRILPQLVRGTAILTRILRRRRVTRPVVTAVPTIVNRTAQTLVQRASAGQPITRQAAGRVMAQQTRRVLTNPRTCARAMQRTAAAARRVPPAPAGRRQAAAAQRRRPY